MAPRKISGCIRKQALPCWKDEKDAMTLQRQKVQRQQQRFLRQKIPQTKLSRLKWFSVTSLLLPLQPLLLFFSLGQPCMAWLSQPLVDTNGSRSDRQNVWYVKIFCVRCSEAILCELRASLCVPKSHPFHCDSGRSTTVCSRHPDPDWHHLPHCSSILLRQRQTY